MQQEEWSRSDRRQALWLAILPALSAAVFVVLLFGHIDGFVRGLPLTFLVFASAAYLSLVVGVWPALLLLRKLGWQGWLPHALAGYVGVLFTWTIPGAFLGWFDGRGGMGSFAALSVPGGIAAVACVVYWFFCIRLAP